MPDIRKGDTVQIIAGKEKGKTGKVLAILREKGRVRIVETRPLSKDKRWRVAETLEKGAEV